MIIGLVILAIFIVYAIVATIFTMRTKSMSEQELFTNSKFPDPIPNGDLKGNADNQGSWLGKSFDSAAGTGINRFNDDGMITRSSKFVTYKGNSITDPEKEVLTIDYNIPENPIFLRVILDELVEIAPGKYLGKLQLRIIPFIPFTVQYFRLEK
ncbi:MAG: hypothetical protein ABI721_05590 [Candidatus Dojkabacteria bacterium]